MELTETEINAVEKIKADAQAAYEKDRQILEQQHQERFVLQMQGVLSLLRQLHGLSDDFVFSEDLRSLVARLENNK